MPSAVGVCISTGVFNISRGNINGNSPCFILARIAFSLGEVAFTKRAITISGSQTFFAILRGNKFEK